MFYLLHVLPPSSNWKKEDPELDKQKTVDAWMDAVPRVKKKRQGGEDFLTQTCLHSWRCLDFPLFSICQTLCSVSLTFFSLVVESYDRDWPVLVSLVRSHPSRSELRLSATP